MIKLPWQRVEQDLGWKLSGHVAVDLLYEAKKKKPLQDCVGHEGPEDM